MTTRTMNAEEVALLSKMVQDEIAANVPGWAQGMIPQDALHAAIVKGVAAIDALRDKG